MRLQILRTLYKTSTILGWKVASLCSQKVYGFVKGSLGICILLSLASCIPGDQMYTLHSITNPTAPESSLPRLFTDNTDKIFMSWVEKNGKETVLLYSSLKNDIWSKPEEISRSSDWFVNWADFPSVIAQDGKAISAHWLKKIPGNTYSYNVEVASAKSNWNDVVTPHTDNTATEHGFVSMVPHSDSTFLSIWLDGRNMETGHGGHDNYGDLNTAMTLRSAILTHDLDLLQEAEIDASVCECCGTSAVRVNDGFLVAFRNRTSEEIRDIYVSKLTSEGWSKPISVHNDNWNIAACPVNGPSLSALNEKVAVAWYTAANDTSKVLLSFSENSGNSFAEPIRVDTGLPLGRVDVQVLADGLTFVSWLERNPDDRSKAYFMVKLLSGTNQVIQEFKVAEISSSRSTGFPQITSSNNQLVLAWTELSEDESRQIKTAILK